MDAMGIHLRGPSLRDGRVLWTCNNSKEMFEALLYVVFHHKGEQKIKGQNLVWEQ
jgi:hypothetical protein